MEQAGLTCCRGRPSLPLRQRAEQGVQFPRPNQWCAAAARTRGAVHLLHALRTGDAAQACKHAPRSSVALLNHAIPTLRSAFR